MSPIWSQCARNSLAERTSQAILAPKNEFEPFIEFLAFIASYIQ